MGLAAARAGAKTLIVELEGRSSLGAPFGIETLDYDSITIDTGEPDTAPLSAQRITPDEALVDYLSGQHGFQAVSSRLAKTNAVELITTTAPGIRDLLTLGKIRNLESAGEHDLIIVDAPAAGHAISFLQTAAGMAASAPSGPLRVQADQAIEMLADERRLRVMLVTLPEETPVTELVETAFTLEDEVGVHLAPVVVNGLWPVIDGLDRVADDPSTRSTGPKANRVDAARYRLARQENQRAEVRRLAETLPLPQIHLPFLFCTSIDREAIATLADQFAAGLPGLGGGQ